MPPSVPAILGKAALELVVRVVDASRTHAAAVLAGAALLSVLAAWLTATQLSVNTDTTDMLSPDLPFRRAHARLQEAFPQLRDVAVVVVTADAGVRARDAADRLAAAMRRDTRRFVSVYQPGGGPFFARNGLLYLEPDRLERLADRLAEAQPFVAAVARDPGLRGLAAVLVPALRGEDAAVDRLQLAKVLREIDAVAASLAAGAPQPLRWREALLDSGDDAGAHRRFVLVQPRLDHGQPRPAAAALAALRDLAARVERETPGVRVGITGDVPVGDDELRSVAVGAKVTSAVALGLVCVLIVFGLRSLRAGIAVLVTLCAGLLWTAAFAAVGVGQLNLISATFAVLFIGLGVDFGVQFAMRYQEELAPGAGAAVALRRAAAGVGGALALAAGAAGVAFLAFTPTAFRGLAELGVIAAFGMAVALAANLTVLPALLTLLHPGAAAPARTGAGGLVGALNEKGRRRVLAIAAIAALAAAVLLPRAEFDFNPLRLKDARSPPVAAFIELTGDPDSTPYAAQVLAPNLERADELAASLRRSPLVRRAVTLTSFVPSDLEARRQIIDDMNLVFAPVTPLAATATPLDERDALARLRGALAAVAGDDALALAARGLERALESASAAYTPAEAMPAQLGRLVIGDLPLLLEDLQQLLAPDLTGLADLPPDLRRRYVAPDGTARVEVIPARDLTDNRAMAEFVRAVQAMAPAATGAPVIFVEAGAAVVEACLQATALALAASLLGFAWVLGGIGRALLVLLPVTLAALYTGGATVLLGISVNLANVIALPLLLGLSVAFGVYIVLRVGESGGVAGLAASGTPRAVLYSALTTAVSFGSLAFSAHPGMAGMGELLSLALLMSLLSSLVVLPAMIGEVETRSDRAPRA
ncbi:MAG: MMPL family transporter [Pseudomonadota bacterium]